MLTVFMPASASTTSNTVGLIGRSFQVIRIAILLRLSLMGKATTAMGKISKKTYRGFKNVAPHLNLLNTCDCTDLIVFSQIE